MMASTYTNPHWITDILKLQGFCNVLYCHLTGMIYCTYEYKAEVYLSIYLNISSA